MRLIGHLLGGFGLLLVATWLIWRAAHVERTGFSKVSDNVIRVLTLGSSPTREGWLWRLRATNLVMAGIILIGAVTLLATA